MKSLQFELWRECNNLCKMCFLGLENRTTPKHTKIESLNEAIKMTVDFTGEVIAIIGGEFFQGQLNDPEVHDLFYNFLNIVIEKLNNEEIKSSWVTATLTDKTPKDLLEFLNFIKEKWTGKGTLFICTSYDTIGRFHTEEKRLNWMENMDLIHKTDPRIKLNTTMILTNDLMETYLNNKIDFTDFSVKFNTSLMIKHPNSGPYKSLKRMEQALPNFVPKRNTAIRFFRKMKLKDGLIFENKVFNVELRADECVRRNNRGDSFPDVRDKQGTDEYSTYIFNPGTTECGHSKLYRCYIDSDKCMMCDYLKIKKDF